MKKISKSFASILIQLSFNKSHGSSLALGIFAILLAKIRHRSPDRALVEFINSYSEWRRVAFRFMRKKLRILHFRKVNSNINASKQLYHWPSRSINQSHSWYLRQFKNHFCSFLRQWNVVSSIHFWCVVVVFELRGKWVNRSTSRNLVSIYICICMCERICMWFVTLALCVMSADGPVILYNIIIYSSILRLLSYSWTIYSVGVSKLNRFPINSTTMLH